MTGTEKAVISEKQGIVGKKRNYALMYKRKDRSMNEVAWCVQTTSQMGATRTMLLVSIRLYLSHSEKTEPMGLGSECFLTASSSLKIHSMSENLPWHIVLL